MVALDLGATDDPGKSNILTIIFSSGCSSSSSWGHRNHREPAEDPDPAGKARRGRRVFGGSPIFPLKVNHGGVMPIIFASSLLIFPSFVFNSLSNATSSMRNDNWSFGSFFAGVFQELSDAFQRQSYIYTICYIVLIYFFCYFWTAITFNPKDMAENLKDYGSFIPGYRPGRRTADYLEKVMLRITYVGAAFLALVAVIPSLVQASLGVDWTVASFLGGTGLLYCHQRLPRPCAEDRQPPGRRETTPGWSTGSERIAGSLCKTRTFGSILNDRGRRYLKKAILCRCRRNPVPGNHERVHPWCRFPGRLSSRI